MSAKKRTAATRLHILCLDPLFHGGELAGPARTFTICGELTRVGHRVTVLTASSSCQDTNDNLMIVGAGERAHTRFGYPSPPRIRRFFALHALRRIWRIADADIALTADSPLALLPITALFCAIRGIPLVIDARAGLPHGLPTDSLWQRATTTAARNVYRIASRYARRVIVQNTYLREVLIENGVAGKKVIETSAGCNAQLLRPLSAAPDRVEETGAQGAKGSIVTYAGGIPVGAGLEFIVDIAAAMPSTQPIVTFMIYGDGPGRKHLEEHARKAGVFNKSVRFFNPVALLNLHHVLKTTTVAIGRIQNRDEWGPNGHVLDALMEERPVIFPGDNPHRELVVGRGAGLALPPHDPQTAAHELSDFLNDTDGLRRAREQAAALAAGRLNGDRVAADIRGELESAVSEAPRATVIRRRMLRTKRAIDILLSLGVLILLSPVLIGLAIAIRIKMGSPVLFSQQRPGMKGKIFKLYKFRTMTDVVDSAGAALPDKDRLTSLGQFMRRTSLDELPELFNVLLGEMSLVGPRPLLAEYLPHYSSEQRQRHDVLPGITGWTQINGRNALTWEEKFKLDVWYVDNMSLLLDFKILLKTIWVAARGEGVSAPGYSTMPRFDEIVTRREGAEDD
jgi:lipopolysaccharide/colanic/teichoic acid biosynthesis glycosyltransferase/glycosyltransferase involved in cell wall biosynthesis